MATPAALAEVITLPVESRIERLRQAVLDAKAGVSIDRARIETRAMRATEGEPVMTRRAKVFAAIVRDMPIAILPDELIVGWISGKPFCSNVSPADGPQLERVLSRDAARNSRKSQSRLVGVFSSLPYDMTMLTEDEKGELFSDLIPYWKGEGNYEKTLWGYNQEQSGNPRNQHIGHNCIDYQKVLVRGFLGIRDEVQERLGKGESLDDDGRTFLEGVVTAMTAAAEIGERYAACARSCAASETDPARRAELLSLAEVCDRVPAHPARTFHEALQAHFFTWTLLFWEQPIVSAVSPGGIDQLLLPYYERDLAEGRLTRKEAQELLDCYILKLNQIPRESLSTHVHVGGIKADGGDATNELSFMLIESMMHTRLMAPIFSVQVHSKVKDDLLVKASQLCALGTGHPQFINHDVAVAQTLARGCLDGPPISLADARSATPVGCVELVIPAKDAGWTGGTGLINYAACMEYVLTNGRRRTDGKLDGVETGDPKAFQTYDDVVEAFRRQVVWQLERGKKAADGHERSFREMAPTPFESALIEGCLETATCREAGGATHNSSNQILPIAPIDAADSLTAIRKLVFEDRTLTMAELCDALDDDFEGHEKTRQLLLSAPKYGNDDDYADEQATLVNHLVASEGLKLGKNPRGGDGAIVGGSAWWLFAAVGTLVGALPSGRKAGDILNDAHSPCSGFDVNGPTAVLKSMGKIDNKELMGGVLLNLRLDPGVVRTDSGIGRLVGLVRGFMDQQILHVQFNIVSSDVLRDAQREPEKHQDLLVKVAGYSAFFVQLTKPNQDAIIARTEHAL